VYREKGANDEPSLALTRENDRLRRALRDRAELIDLLVSLPENEALGTLRRLRATSNLSRVLAVLQGSMHGRQRPSLGPVNRALSPPTESVLEFELTELHPIIYPRLAPLRAESIAEQLRGGSETAQLKYEAPATILRKVSGGAAESSPQVIVSGVSPSHPHSPLLDIRVASRPIGPSPNKSYCDGRLRQLCISFWTEVALTDDYAASLISFYLEKFHPVSACFDADGFLTDLTECRQRFCSSFLVNAVLFNAAVSVPNSLSASISAEFFQLMQQQYVGVDIRAADLVRPFFHEAERLWNIERHHDSVITLGASQILGIGCHTYGPDNVAQEVTYAGRQMAERLGLLGVPDDNPAAKAWKQKTPHWKKMAAYVAWGCYNWFS